MLVLSRKVDEEIIIAGEIRVKVLRISGNKVQLGIIADKSIRIERSEIRNEADYFELAASEWHDLTPCESH